MALSKFVPLLRNKEWQIPNVECTSANYKNTIAQYNMIFSGENMRVTQRIFVLKSKIKNDMQYI